MKNYTINTDTMSTSSSLNTNTPNNIYTNTKSSQVINTNEPERYNPPADGQPTAPIKLTNANTSTSTSVNNTQKGMQSQTNQSFTQKLYTMLSDESLKDLIWWSQSMDSFMIKPNERFSKALSIYFKHTNVASFVRQLNMYGFHKINTSESTTNETNASGTNQSRNISNPTSNTTSGKKKSNVSEDGINLWEFKHSKSYFRKGDLENLKKIKRRASKNTVTHVATSTTIRNGTAAGPSTTRPIINNHTTESSGAPTTRLHPLGYNPPLGNNKSLNNYTINHRNSYPGEATTNGSGNTVGLAPQTLTIHANESQTGINTKPFYSNTQDARSSSLNNLPAALPSANNSSTNIKNTSNNNNNNMSTYNKNNLHNSTLINNQFAHSLHRSSVTSVSSMPTVCNPPGVPANMDSHLMDPSKPRNNSVPANAYKDINNQLPSPMENYTTQSAHLQQSPTSFQRKSLSNSASESMSNMENSKMFQLVIDELQNISTDNIQILELFQYYLSEKRNDGNSNNTNYMNRSDALLNDLQSFKTNIANRSNKIIDLLKNKNMAYLQLNNNNLINNNNTVSNTASTTMGGNNEMVKSEQIGSAVHMYPNVPATVKTPPPPSLTSSSFTGMPGQVQGNSSLRNMSVIDPLQPLPSQQVQSYQPQLNAQHAQHVQHAQHAQHAQQANQTQQATTGQHEFTRATPQPQHYVPSNAPMSPFSVRTYEMSSSNPQVPPKNTENNLTSSNPTPQQQQHQQQVKNEPMAYKPYYPFGIMPLGAGYPKNDVQQKQQPHVQNYQPQLQHQEYVTPHQSQPVVNYPPSNNSNQSVVASQSQQQTPFFARTNSNPSNKLRISVSSSATTMSSSNDFHSHHNTNNNDNSAGNGNESRVSVSSLPLTMGTATSFLPNHQYIQMPSTQAIININDASSRKNSANNNAGAYSLPGLSQPNIPMQSVPQHNVAQPNFSLPGLPRLNSSVSASSSSTLLNASHLQHKPSVSGSNPHSKSDLYSLLNTRNDSSNTESAEQQHQLLQKLNNTSAQATIGMKRTYSDTYGSRAHSNNIDPKTPAPL